MTLKGHTHEPNNSSMSNYNDSDSTATKCDSVATTNANDDLVTTLNVDNAVTARRLPDLPPAYVLHGLSTVPVPTNAAVSITQPLTRATNVAAHCPLPTGTKDVDHQSPHGHLDRPPTALHANEKFAVVLSFVGLTPSPTNAANPIAHLRTPNVVTTTTKESANMATIAVSCT